MICIGIITVIVSIWRCRINIANILRHKYTSQRWVQGEEIHVIDQARMGCSSQFYFQQNTTVKQGRIQFVNSNAFSYIKILLHSAGGHQGSRKAYYTGK